MTTHAPQNTAQPTETKETPRIYKIYPSSAAWMVGPQVQTTSNKSCHRYLWAQAHCGLTKGEFPNGVAEEYKAIGTLNEWLFQEELKKEGIEADREVVSKTQFKSAEISGRMDFRVAGGIVWEVKSVTSEHVHRRVFKDGQPEPSWVAQLASYLAFEKLPEGRIVAAYYELNVTEELPSIQMVAKRTFIVKTLDNGVLCLDGVPYQYNLRDLARWYSELEKNLSQTSTPGQRPCQPANRYQSPCYFCPLSKTCDSFDAGGMDVASFQSEAKAAFLTVRPKDFKIKRMTERVKKLRETKLRKSKETTT